MMDTITIIICCLICFYLGYTIAKGIDNNHRELFQGYMDEQLKLSQEKYYYEQCYIQLINSIHTNEEYYELIEDEIKNSRDDIVKVIYKKNKKEKKIK